MPCTLLCLSTWRVYRSQPPMIAGEIMLALTLKGAMSLATVRIMPSMAALLLAYATMFGAPERALLDVNKMLPDFCSFMILQTYFVH